MIEKFFSVFKKQNHEPVSGVVSQKILTPFSKDEKGLIDKAAKNLLNLDDNMSGREFEIFLADLFSLCGYEVEMKPDKNEGIDLVITKNGVSTQVQAKCWSLETSYKAEGVHKGKDVVRKSHIDEFIAALSKQPGNVRGAFITTHFFTANARRVADAAKQFEIELIDRVDLISFIAQNHPQVIAGAFLEKTIGKFGNCPKCGNILIYKLIGSEKKKSCPNYPDCQHMEDDNI